MLNHDNPNKLDWWIIAIVAIIATILGTIGFDQYSISTHGLQLTPFEALYRSLQLFVLESGALDASVPFTLEIARWLAPFITFFVAIKGILLLLHSKSSSLLRLKKIQQHAIVCGLGEKGSHIATGLLKKGLDVVAIECNEQTNYLSGLEKKGAIVIIGDAYDSSILQQAKVQSARYLITLTNKDTKNIGIIHQAHALIMPNNTQKSSITLNCYAHVGDYDTKELFYNHALFSEGEKKFNAQLFNLYDRGARMLFDSYAPDQYRPAQKEDDPVVSILIFGFSPLAKSLIIHAARTGYYANGKKLSITIVDEHAEQSLASLALSKPALTQIIDVKTYDMYINGLSTIAIQGILSTLPDAVYICMKENIPAITLSHRLRQLLVNDKTPVVAGLLQQDTLAQLLEGGNRSYNSGIYLFPLIDKTNNCDQVIGEQLDHEAKIIHDIYCDDQFALGDTREENPSLIPWENLSEGMKDSNRGQADHLSIKLRAIGLSLVEAMMQKQPLTFTEQQIQILADMEHRRWMAGKLLDGWQHTSGKKDIKLKLTPLLIDFDELPENEKHKDEQSVSIHIPRLIKNLKL